MESKVRIVLLTILIISCSSGAFSMCRIGGDMGAFFECEDQERFRRNSEENQEKMIQNQNEMINQQNKMNQEMEDYMIRSQ